MIYLVFRKYVHLFPQIKLPLSELCEDFLKYDAY